MPARSPLRATVVATRRTALGCGILALTTLSACDVSLTGEERQRPSAGASDDPAPQSSATPADDLDAALVEDVLAELDSMVALVTAAATTSPRLSPAMTALRELHLAHAAALGTDAVAPSTSPSPEATTATPKHDAGSTRSRVAARERRLQRRLADWSVASDSGALARLLASMSAAVAQYVVHHLDEQPAAQPGTPGGEEE